MARKFPPHPLEDIHSLCFFVFLFVERVFYWLHGDIMPDLCLEECHQPVTNLSPLSPDQAPAASIAVRLITIM
jgi:hypothetical protein